IVAAEAAANDWAAGNSAASRGAILASWGDHGAAARVLLAGIERHGVSGNRMSIAQNVASLCFIFAGAGRPDAAAVLDGWARTIATAEAIATELRLGGWSETVVEAVLALPATLGDGEYRRLVALGAALSDDELISYLSTEVGRLEQEQA